MKYKGFWIEDLTGNGSAFSVFKDDVFLNTFSSIADAKESIDRGELD